MSKKPLKLHRRLLAVVGHNRKLKIKQVRKSKKPKNRNQWIRKSDGKSKDRRHVKRKPRCSAFELRICRMKKRTLMVSIRMSSFCRLIIRVDRLEAKVVNAIGARGSLAVASRIVIGVELSSMRMMMYAIQTRQELTKEAVKVLAASSAAAATSQATIRKTTPQVGNAASAPESTTSGVAAR